MDQHTEICIALGAATAANCVPCFEHYFSKRVFGFNGLSKNQARTATDGVLS